MNDAATILPDYVMADISDHANIPCGRRGYLVLREGTRYAHLFCPRTLRVIRLDLDIWDTIEFERIDYDPRKLTERLAGERARREQSGHWNGGAALEKALEWLEGGEG